MTDIDDEPFVTEATQTKQRGRRNNDPNSPGVTASVETYRVPAAKTLFPDRLPGKAGAAGRCFGPESGGRNNLLQT